MNTPTPSPLGWGIVAALLACSTAAGLVLDHSISLTSQAMIYVLAVVVASYYLQWQQSMACAVGAVIAFNFFFVPPRWTFDVDSRENLIALLAMLLVAVVISHLSARLRQETETAQQNLRRARQLQELATHLATANTEDEVVGLGQSALNAAFAGLCCLALRGTGDALDLPPNVTSEEADGLHCSLRDAALLGPGTGRWPGLNAWFLPLGSAPDVCGAACVRPAVASDTRGREHAQALCALLGQALQRLRLTDTMQSAQREAQRQQIQSTYLAAISHDLRTPLAAIVGAASALQTQGDKLDSDEKDRLLGSVATEATYLCTVTENTLQLVRLSNAAQDIQRSWESMEEIVGAVLARVRLHDPARRIKSKVPEGLPLIQADPVLLAQLIANLLENALKYSTDSIDLSVSLQGESLQVAVKDRGKDIPPEQYVRIFEPYSRGDLSGQRGAGLGLALCRAIAAAHGGTLGLRRRSGGGNCFTFAIPLNGQPPQGVLP